MAKIVPNRTPSFGIPSDGKPSSPGRGASCYGPVVLSFCRAAVAGLTPAGPTPLHSPQGDGRHHANRQQTCLEHERPGGVGFEGRSLHVHRVLVRNACSRVFRVLRVFEFSSFRAPVARERGKNYEAERRARIKAGVGEGGY